MRFGTTFAHPYLRDYFKLPVLPAFKSLLDWKFDYVRLACYWAECEKERGKYDFSQLEQLLELASKVGQQVIFTVGMKAPRWPEFYLPTWTAPEAIYSNPEFVLEFVDRCLTQLRSYPALRYLQIENEPLDVSGPDKLIVPQFLLEEEIKLVRSLTSLPIVLTMWGNRSLKDDRLSYLAQRAAVVGLDLYWQIPDGHEGYWGPADSVAELQKLITQAKIPVWITELQTNPWKKSPNREYWEIFETNWQLANQLPVEAIILWGFEYWYALWQKGDRQTWDYIRKKVPTK